MTTEVTAARVGDEYTSRLVTDLSRTQIVQYAGASGDFVPVHTDEIYATQVAGFGSVFAHGMLTMAMSGRLVTDQFGPAAVREFGGRFLGKVWPGDSLVGTARVVGADDTASGRILRIDISTRNQDDVEVFRGSAVVVENPGRQFTSS